VPTIHDADQKSLAQIARETKALARKVRDAMVTPAELSGATFTVSNLGMHGIRAFVPVINPPQAAILGVGAVETRAVVHHGELAVRARMSLTLSCDHRIVYGTDAAAFIGLVRDRLERPVTLLD
jgi:pyruvate dehydrogenase E2 component (dihydrolipoyllysine-residue acetyltransferase)